MWYFLRLWGKGFCSEGYNRGFHTIDLEAGEPIRQFALFDGQLRFDSLFECCNFVCEIEFLFEFGLFNCRLLFAQPV